MLYTQNAQNIVLSPILLNFLETLLFFIVILYTAYIFNKVRELKC